MKKEKTISVLIRIADSPVRPKNLLFSLTGCFALLFLGGLGFFSSVKDMSAVPGAVSFWIFPLAGVALLLTFLFGLFLLHKKKRLALLLSGGLLCSLLLFQRKALLAQGSSFLAISTPGWNGFTVFPYFRVFPALLRITPFSSFSVPCYS